MHCDFVNTAPCEICKWCLLKVAESNSRNEKAWLLEVPEVHVRCSLDTLPPPPGATPASHGGGGVLTRSHHLFLRQGERRQWGCSVWQGELLLSDAFPLRHALFVGGRCGWCGYRLEMDRLTKGL
ncbi:unnamed protein product [Boreogadus saida]